MIRNLKKGLDSKDAVGIYEIHYEQIYIKSATVECIEGNKVREILLRGPYLYIINKEQVCKLVFLLTSLLYEEYKDGIYTF